MTDWIGIFCHQLPGRSPQHDGQVFPLCFRCAGIYLGLFAAYVWMAVDQGGWRRRLPGVRATMILCGGMLPLLIDGWANALHLWDTPGWLRALTGIGVGTALPRFLLPLLQSIERTTAPELPSTVDGARPVFGPLMVASGLVLLLALNPGPAMFRSLIVIAGIGMVLLCVNLVGVVSRALLEWLDRKLGRDSPAGRPA